MTIAPNYPVLVCLILLALVGIRILMHSRKREFQTLIFPSSCNLGSSEQGVSLWNDHDIIINCPIRFETIHCRTLYIGPQGVLGGKEISAMHVIVDGVVEGFERIGARTEILVRNRMEARRVDTPTLRLGRKSVASIQIVPSETVVVRGKHSRTAGFFSSEEELRNAAKLTGPVSKPMRKNSSREMHSNLRVVRANLRSK